MSDSPSPQPAGWNRLLAYLELVRLPAVFTAMADVAMGLLFVRGAAEPGRLVLTMQDRWLLGVLLSASSLLYISGMVLNDYFDYAVDTRQRPHRPLPSGRISRRTAGRFGVALMVLGVSFGGVAAVIAEDWRPALVAGLLAVCILLYDGLLKTTPLGPLAMGACRTLNVLLGMSVLRGPFSIEHWLAAGAIGVYIVGVTRFARTEAGPSRRAHLALGTAVMMLGVGMLAYLPDYVDNLTPLLQQQPGRWHVLMATLGALIGWRCLRAIVDPVPALVQPAVAKSILSLVVLDAAICFTVCGMFWAVMVLLLLAPAMILRQWISPT